MLFFNQWRFKQYTKSVDNVEQDGSINPELVTKTLRSLKNHKDQIVSSQFRKVNIRYASHLLVFCQSLNSGQVPDDRELANIIPSFKSGDKNFHSNHRPISLTSVVWKLLESLLKDAL